MQGLLLPSRLSGVWFGEGGTPTHRHFPFLPHKKGCRGGEGLPHIDFGAGYTTHTPPHPILGTAPIHRQR